MDRARDQLQPRRSGAHRGGQQAATRRTSCPTPSSSSPDYLDSNPELAQKIAETEGEGFVARHPDRGRHGGPQPHRRSSTTSWAAGASCPSPTPVVVTPRPRPTPRSSPGQVFGDEHRQRQLHRQGRLLLRRQGRGAEPETVKGERGTARPGVAPDQDHLRAQEPDAVRRGHGPEEHRADRRARERPRPRPRSTRTPRPSRWCSRGTWATSGSSRSCSPSSTASSSSCWPGCCTTGTSGPCRSGPTGTRTPRRPGQGRLSRGPVPARSWRCWCWPACSRRSASWRRGCSTRRGPPRPRWRPTSAASSTRRTRRSGSRCAST